MSEKIQTAWMWQNHDGSVAGATIDLDDALIQWYASLGCACGSSDGEQSIADFLQRGPRFGNPPQDVYDEMKMALDRWLSFNPTSNLGLSL